MKLLNTKQELSIDGSKKDRRRDRVMGIRANRELGGWVSLAFSGKWNGKFRGKREQSKRGCGLESCVFIPLETQYNLGAQRP